MRATFWKSVTLGMDRVVLIPASNSGVGGNLVMQGPPSVLYPNGWNGAAKTIDAWAWPFIETVTV